MKKSPPPPEELFIQLSTYWIPVQIITSNSKRKNNHIYMALLPAMCVRIARRCLYIGSQGVNGGWSLWGSWSFCHANTGKKERRRQCNNPAPCNGGAPCAGSVSEVTKCTTGNIVIYIQVVKTPTQPQLNST